MSTSQGMLSVLLTITWLLRLSNDKCNKLSVITLQLEEPPILRMYPELFAMNIVYLEISYFQPPAFLNSAA